MIEGSCHCGAVTLRVPRPDFVNDCDCSLCRKAGAIWGYFAPDDVEINGATTPYSRTEIAEPTVALQFCPRCGSHTHCTLLGEYAGTRTIANMRMFAYADLHGIERRFPDGANWDSASDYQFRRDPVTIGKDDVAPW